MPTRLARIFAILLFCTVSTAQALVINEIRVDQPGADNDEYFELAGSAGESLDGLSYLVLGDSSAGGSGVVESVTHLSGLQVSASGFFLAAEASFSLGASPDLVTSLNFENSDNVTHLLVRDFSGSLADDLDSNDDGLLDSTPWTAILDSLALVGSGGGEWAYGPVQLGPADGGAVPMHAYRGTDRSGGWLIGDVQPEHDTAGSSNTPYAVPEPASLALLLVGLLVLIPGRGPQHCLSRRDCPAV